MKAADADRNVLYFSTCEMSEITNTRRHAAHLQANKGKDFHLTDMDADSFENFKMTIWLDPDKHQQVCELAYPEYEQLQPSVNSLFHEIIDLTAITSGEGGAYATSANGSASSKYTSIAKTIPDVTSANLDVMNVKPGPQFSTADNDTKFDKWVSNGQTTSIETSLDFWHCDKEGAEEVFDYDSSNPILKPI